MATWVRAISDNMMQVANRPRGKVKASNAPTLKPSTSTTATAGSSSKASEGNKQSTESAESEDNELFGF